MSDGGGRVSGGWWGGRVCGGIGILRSVDGETGGEVDWRVCKDEATLGEELWRTEEERVAGDGGG